MTWPLAMAAGRLFAQSRVMVVSHSQKGALAEKVLRLDAERPPNLTSAIRQWLFERRSGSHA